jgi:hypothetical protein
VSSRAESGYTRLLSHHSSGFQTRTQAYTGCDAEINNEHSSNAKTLIRTNLQDPNKLQAKYNQYWFK